MEKSWQKVITFGQLNSKNALKMAIYICLRILVKTAYSENMEVEKGRRNWNDKEKGVGA